MPREEVEVELLKGLRALQQWETSQAERRSNEIEGVRAAVGNLAAQVQLLSQKIEAQNALWNERFTGLAARVEALEKDADDTSKVNVETLRASSRFWPNLLGKIAVGVVTAALVGTVTYVITRNAAASAEAAQHAGH